MTIEVLDVKVKIPNGKVIGLNQALEFERSVNSELRKLNEIYYVIMV